MGIPIGRINDLYSKTAGLQTSVDSINSSLTGKAPIQTIQYVTPTTGTTVTVTTARNVKLLIDPAGSLLALTIALNGSPQDGDIVQLGSSQAITTLTVTGGTIVGTLTALGVASFATFLYNTTSAKWFRIG